MGEKQAYYPAESGNRKIVIRFGSPVKP